MRCLRNCPEIVSRFVRRTSLSVAAVSADKDVRRTKVFSGHFLKGVAVRCKLHRASLRNRTACAMPLIVCLALVAASTADGADDLAHTYVTQIQPLLVKTCGECHGKMPTDNDLDLTSFDSAQAMIARPKMLSDVADRVRGGDMPPKEAPQPTEA